MRIVELKISNFRGIKSANITFPESSQIVCLIGSGDSTKSTILKAIEWLLYPSNYLPVGDTDFYDCDVANPIEIIGDITCIPEDLMKFEKFGDHLRRRGVTLEPESDNSADDEPQDGENLIMTIRLTVDKNLEPEWVVLGNGKEPKEISSKDRRLFCVGNVGENYARDFSWGRNSVLQKYDNEAKSSVNNACIDAFRKAAEKFKSDGLENIVKEIPEIGKKYGVSVSDHIGNSLRLQGNGFSSAMVCLYEDNVPLNQRGTGSQRLLSIGLNISASKKDTLLLIDEIETGLEPYRICTLINVLRKNLSESGQVIMTTHSPAAVAECSISEIMTVHPDRDKKGNICTRTFKSKNTDSRKAAEENDSMQAMMRAVPEAFLSRRIIVCEGKTELGFIRALDSYLADPEGKYKFRLAHYGVGAASGVGSNLSYYASTLFESGYEICVLMDSDEDKANEKKKDIIDKGACVLSWEHGNSIEEQIFSDVDLDVARQLVDAAVELKSFDAINGELKDKVQFNVDGGRIKLAETDRKELKSIGTIAKNAKWFKTTRGGETMGDIIFDNWDNGKISHDSHLVKTVEDLIAWVMNDDKR